MHTIDLTPTSNGAGDKKSNSQIETAFVSDVFGNTVFDIHGWHFQYILAIDESIQDKPHTILTPSNEIGGAGLEKQESTDEIKDNKSVIKKEDLNNNSSIKELSDYADETSTFRSDETKVEVIENGNKEMPQ